MIKSFTLIELMVVIAIIGILGVVITPVVGKAIEKAKIAKAIAEAKALETALDALYVDTGRQPGDNPRFWITFISLDPDYSNLSFDPDRMRLSSLLTDDDGWPGWDGPYLKNLHGRNPWGGTNLFLKIVFMEVEGLYLRYYPLCYRSTSDDLACGMPDNVGEKIDQVYDNDDISPWSGNFFKSTGSWYWKIAENQWN
jgi:prepilin-type N-terminal cleavage/methylation domain-containing protein